MTNNCDSIKKISICCLMTNLNFLINIYTSLFSLLMIKIVLKRFLNSKINFDETTIDSSFFNCENS